MTTLPSRNTLSAIGQTYGQVRVALGDLRDFVYESLGATGGSPQIPNATLSNVVKIGVRTATPGADVQIYGSLALSTSSAAVSNPGDGNLSVAGYSIFAENFDQKLQISYPSSAVKCGIGIQSSSVLYYRSPVNGYHIFYAGGQHNNTGGAPGTGGEELLRINTGEFKYKGNTIYHSGNGVFLRKDIADTAAGKIYFTGGAELNTGNLDIVPGNIINFQPSTGKKIRLYDAGNDNFSLGIQGDTLYIRAGANFAVYSGGVHSDAVAPSPGSGGITLLHANANIFTWMGQTVYHTGNSNFVPKASTNRPGVDRLYRNDVDAGDYIRHYWDAPNAQFKFQAIDANGNAQYVAIDRADYARNSSITGRTLLSYASTTRPGVDRMYVDNVDEANYIVARRQVDNSLRLYGNTGGTVVNSADNATNAAYATSSGSTNYINGNNIADGTVRFYELSLAQGSASGSDQFDFGVHQYAFGSPYYSNGGYGNSRYIMMGSTATAGRVWSFRTIREINTSGQAVSAVWDYITGSGDPYTWVVVDDRDNIIFAWDAEDPFDRELIDESPIMSLGNSQRAVKIALPSPEELNPVIAQVERAKLPGWMGKSKYKDRKTPGELFKGILKDYTDRRALMKQYTEDMKLNEFMEDLEGDEQKKAWRRQAVLRAASRVITGGLHPNIPDMLISHYKVDKKKGTIQLK